MYAQTGSGTNSRYSLNLAVKQGKSVFKSRELKNAATSSDTYTISGKVQVSSAYKGSIKYNASLADDPDWHVVTFDANGGRIKSNGQSSIKAGMDEGEALNTAFGGKLPEAEYGGHDFVGWFTVADDNSGTQVATNAKMGKTDVTYYAHWKLKQYNVHFDANGGTGTMANQQFTYDQSQMLTANKFTRDGYDFAGWNTQANGKGTAYTDKQTVKNLAESGTVTLYAQWSQLYHIYYNLDGTDDNDTAHKGYWSSDNPGKASYSAAFGYSLPTPNRDGYGFLGWRETDKNHLNTPDTGTKAAPNASLTIPKGATGDKYFKAVWSTELIPVQCEDWLVDWNGNPYVKYNDVSYSKNVAPGATVSSEALFGTTAYDQAYQDLSVRVHGGATVFFKGESVKIDTKNHIVRRLFKIQAGSGSAGYWHILSYDEKGLNAVADMEATYYDRQGNVIYHQTFKDVSNYVNGQYDMFNIANVLPSSGGYPTGGEITVSNIRIVKPGYTFFGRGRNDSLIYKSSDWKTRTYGFWVQATLVDWTGTQFSRRYNMYNLSDAKLQTMTFEQTDPLDPEAASLTYGSSKMLTIDDLYNAQAHNSGAQKQLPIKYGTKIHKVAMAAQPGYILDDHAAALDEVGAGINTLFAKAPGQTITMQSGGHLVDVYVKRNAYGIAYNANGGAGDMASQCIDNTTPAGDAKRKLTKNVYTRQNMQFKGWALSKERADQGIVDYADQAAMPVISSDPSTIGTLPNFNICQMTTLYAVWG